MLLLLLGVSRVVVWSATPILVLYYCIMDTYVSGEPVYSLMFRPGRYDYDDYGFWRDVWSTDDVKLGSVMIGNVGINESVPGVVSYKPAD